jgi:predicted membrane-bound spermidine synthase
MTPPPRSPRNGLLAIFVLSGFAGLIYQSIWSHYLGLFLGHAAYAQALVLAIFMGGMAAGAAWIAHAGQRWRNLIRVYAVIEAIIGVFGLLFHSIYGSVASFSYDTLIPALGSPLAIDIARWTIAALLILPQTVLLGMTFPLMSGGLIRRFSGQDGSLLGGLYFTNSIGAAFGALIAVFVLLPSVGLPGAMVAAGILNFVVAGLAWWLAREPEPTISVSAPKEAQMKQRLLHNPLLRAVLLGTALSGAASFVYEIVWIRMLSMAVGSTMHAFELMLASFIAGIALGGLWVRKHADRTDSPLRMVGWMQIGMGVAALASLAVYANAFSWVGWLIQSLTKTDGAYTLFHAGTATLAVLIMLPAAFFAGTTLPLFTVALLQGGLGERAIGRVYAWNTLGSIIGVFAAIHLLIPLMGLKLTLCVAALLDLGIGLALLRWQADSNKQMLRFSIAAGLAAVALIVAVRIPYDPLTLASGVFRHGRSQIAEGTKMLSYRDGKTASVSVFQAPTGVATIATNGKPDAAMNMLADGKPTDDEPTMVMLGALPLALIDKPDNVAVIGFGSGLTTHTLLGDPRIKSVSTIEIEQAMVDGARAFGPRVARAYTDPRSHVVIDDAKAHFAGQHKKFDLIISEPSNPWISGVGALFSKEFYQFVPRHLNENGLFVQWVQLYEINDELLGSILQALTPAFSDYSAWISNNTDLIIVASPQGKLPKLDMERLVEAKILKSEMARLGITSVDNMNFRQVADARLLRAAATAYSSLPPNSDYLPVLGLHAPKTRFLSSAASAFFALPFINGNLLEAMGTRHPFSSSLKLPTFSNFVADHATDRARSIAQELRGPLSSGAYPDVVLLKAMSGSDCRAFQQDQNARARWSSQVRMLFDITQPFLSLDLMEGVWAAPTWQRCKTIRPDFNRVLALLASHARRDYTTMARLGRDWLDIKPQKDDEFLSNDFDIVAVSGLLLALVHEQRWDDIDAALIKYASVFPADGEYRYQRDLIAALAQNQKNPSSGR